MMLFLFLSFCLVLLSHRMIRIVSVNRGHSITANCPVIWYWSFLSSPYIPLCVFSGLFHCYSSLSFFLFIFLLLSSLSSRIINILSYDHLYISHIHIYIHIVSMFYFIYVCVLVSVADRIF